MGKQLVRRPGYVQKVKDALNDSKKSLRLSPSEYIEALEEIKEEVDLLIEGAKASQRSSE